MEAAGGVVQHQRLLHDGRAEELVRQLRAPTGRTGAAGFDTFDLTVDLVIDPDLSTRSGKGGALVYYLTVLGCLSGHHM
ncbi:hypothetical protein [Streptomyces sp. RKAG293]|uniref:hypothetical protein n=1 Tax=Streptomyces sp. RKAG293 TaxID=2893403 RepID=UPI0020336165|nr:hypothetical protein [Streptomyces sp. RKAG293]MCM2416663.1 hypothetical protein [Streptomyces sp. RKAG293]